jgi:hypothetical protein
MSKFSRWLRKHKPRAHDDTANPAPPQTAIVGGAILSLDPPIVYTTLGWPDPLQRIEAFGSSLGEGPAAILVYMSWALDAGPTSERAVRELRRYRRAHPRREVYLLCNAPEEVENLARLGEAGVLLNHNLTVSETQFRPLAEAVVDFDAVYNARTSRQKRIDLAGAIGRVAYIATTIEGNDPEGASSILADMRGKAPQYVILNRWEGGHAVWLTAEEVNQAYNRAALGLCLSPVEGAMLSSM